MDNINEYMDPIPKKNITLTREDILLTNEDKAPKDEYIHDYEKQSEDTS